MYKSIIDSIFKANLVILITFTLAACSGNQSMPDTSSNETSEASLNNSPSSESGYGTRTMEERLAAYHGGSCKHD